VDDFFSRWEALLLREPLIDHAAEYRAGNGRDPEQPQLLQRPTAHKERRARAARRVHRRVGDRDADQVDQREAEPDGNRCESRGSALVRSAHDHEEEDEREDDLRDQARQQGILAGRMSAIAVGGKAPCQTEARLAACDHKENAGSGNCARHLSCDVGEQFGGGEAVSGPEANRDGRVQMTARNMADGERHGQHRQPECQCHAQIANANIGNC